MKRLSLGGLCRSLKASAKAWKASVLDIGYARTLVEVSVCSLLGLTWEALHQASSFMSSLMSSLKLDINYPGTQPAFANDGK